uniref:hypothetical protein n=1 Tax=Pseudomonas chlororaphis TaxID=587753 RepID=UPI001C834C04
FGVRVLAASLRLDRSLRQRLQGRRMAGHVSGGAGLYSFLVSGGSLIAKRAIGPRQFLVLPEYIFSR